MKKLVNLKGAKALNREQQKAIFGGDPPIPHGDGNGGASGSGNGTVGCHDGYEYSPIDCDDPNLLWYACRDHGGWSICVG